MHVLSILQFIITFTFVILQISNTDGADSAAIAGGMVDAEVRIYIFT